MQQLQLQQESISRPVYRLISKLFGLLAKIKVSYLFLSTEYPKSVNVFTWFYNKTAALEIENTTVSIAPTFP